MRWTLRWKSIGWVVALAIPACSQEVTLVRVKLACQALTLEGQPSPVAIPLGVPLAVRIPGDASLRDPGPEDLGEWRGAEPAVRVPLRCLAESYPPGEVWSTNVRGARLASDPGALDAEGATALPYGTELGVIDRSDALALVRWRLPSGERWGVVRAEHLGPPQAPDVAPSRLAEVAVPAWDGPAGHWREAAARLVVPAEERSAFEQALGTASPEAAAALARKADLGVVLSWLGDADEPADRDRALAVAGVLEPRAAAARLAELPLAGLEDLLERYLGSGLALLAQAILAHLPAQRFESRRLLAAWVDLAAAFPGERAALPDPVPADGRPRATALGERFLPWAPSNPCLRLAPPPCPAGQTLQQLAEAGGGRLTFCSDSAEPATAPPALGRILGWSASSPYPVRVEDRGAGSEATGGRSTLEVVECQGGFPRLRHEGSSRSGRRSAFRGFGLLQASAERQPPCADERLTWYADGVPLAHSCGRRLEAPEGPTTLLWASGERRCAGDYDPRTMARRGTWRCWRQDGTLLSAGSFYAEDFREPWQTGLPHGEWKLYHPGGQLWQRGSFVQGVRSGPWEELDESGVLLSRGAYLAETDPQGRPTGAELRVGRWELGPPGQRREPFYLCGRPAPPGVLWLDDPAAAEPIGEILAPFVSPGFSALRPDGEDFRRPECGELAWHQLRFDARQDGKLLWRHVQHADALPVDGVRRDQNRIRFYLRGRCEPWTFTYPGDRTAGSARHPLAHSAPWPDGGGREDLAWIRSDHAQAVGCGMH